MKFRSLLLSVLTLVALSDFANAGFFLYVHFGDTDIDDKDDVRSNFDPGAETLTASYYLQLTDNSTLYAYRFSVRFNDQKLNFVSRTQSRPNPLVIDPFLNDAQDPGPVDQSVVSPLPNFKELRRFRAIDPAVRNLPSPGVLQAGFYKLASTTFAVRNGQTLTPGEELIVPGEFDFDPGEFGGQDVLNDAFESDDVVGPQNVNPRVYPTIVRGTVTAVPEPSSVLLLAVVGGLALLFRRLRKLCVFAIARRLLD